MACHSACALKSYASFEDDWGAPCAQARVPAKIRSHDAGECPRWCNLVLNPRPTCCAVIGIRLDGGSRRTQVIGPDSRLSGFLHRTGQIPRLQPSEKPSAFCGSEFEVRPLKLWSLPIHSPLVCHTLPAYSEGA